MGRSETCLIDVYFGDVLVHEIYRLNVNNDVEVGVGTFCPWASVIV